MNNYTKQTSSKTGTPKFTLLLIAMTLFLCQCTPTKNTPKPTTPNILLIIIDDLGYSDLGCYGSEIDTKNIDALAEEGLRFTNFYASPNCSPSRAMLMSGMGNHLAGIGAMAALTGPNQKGKPGYEGYLNKRTVAFSELLKDENYRTYYTGKWHLGTNEIANPNARGFDKAWWQADGTPGSHFDLSSPPFLNNRPNYFENDQVQTKAAPNFFSTDFYTEKLIEYLDLDKSKSTPFLGVLSFSAVHLPVHCPESHIDLYKGKYNEGYQKLRATRLKSQKEKGIVAKEVTLAKLPHNVKPWEELTDEEKQDYARKMEVYAGMIKHVDDNVGKLVNYLKQTNQYEQTLIFVLSDNGGAGFNGYQSERGKAQYAKANNVLENIGRKGSSIFIGAGWGSAISTPFRLFKRHISEGGLRIPMIVGGGYLNLNLQSKNNINHEIFTLRDLAPTIQDIAGVAYPNKTYKGRNLLPQTGKSFATLLKNNSTKAIHPKDEIFGWELFKRKAVQKNGWKILWIEPDFGKGKWELFNLKKDPTEQNDLANEQPEKLQEMIKAWEQYQQENNVIMSDGELLFP